MKTRILSLLLVLIMVVGVLASCGGGGACAKHGVDKNSDGKCDNCGVAFTCTHEDKNHNLKCDKCEAKVECAHELDEEGYCLYCDYNECRNHIDRDHNLVCDNDNCDEAVACLTHCDPDLNNTCDWCGVPFTCAFLAKGEDHVDENQDGGCDSCLFMMEDFDFLWTSGSEEHTSELQSP